MNGLQPGARLLGRKFVGDGPSGAAFLHPQPILPIQPIDLINHAVDVVTQIGPPVADAGIESQNFVDAATAGDQRIDGKPPSPQSVQKSPMGGGHGIRTLARGIGEQT